MIGIAITSATRPIEFDHSAWAAVSFMYLPVQLGM